MFEKMFDIIHHLVAFAALIFGIMSMINWGALTVEGGLSLLVAFLLIVERVLRNLGIMGRRE